MNKELQMFLCGKQLLKEEIPFPEMVLQACEREGNVRSEGGICVTRRGCRCKRCGNGESGLFGRYRCACCQTEVFYCRNCIMMGRVSECSKLYVWSGPPADLRVRHPSLAWNGTLSDGQREASLAIVRAVCNRETYLIWAVCGAGKTEMLFAGIHRALQNGERVCIAAPRTDVVLELYPRLRQAFPNVPIAALYGGSSDRKMQAPLTISTTHQLLRFYLAFDVLIIDEVDAFPYSADRTLQYAAEKARKKNSTLIYLTATPNEAWKRDVRRGTRQAVIVPARYHRHPIPVPSFTWCGDWKRKLRRSALPSPLMRWIRQHLHARPIFLFVPHVKHIEPVVSVLKHLDERIEGVHAKDEGRKEKVMMFREGKVPLLVTTTILERGVTIAGVQVAVLGAEDAIFTESALVQIAGRAGRSATLPAGDVIYFHFGKTEHMIAAKQHIEHMNKQAKKRGLI